LAVLVGILSVALPAPAGSYAFTTIDVPGAVDTEAWGINTAGGQVAGVFRDAGHKWHGYLRSADGAFTTIEVPGAD
jgi:hypothetical protein